MASLADQVLEILERERYAVLATADRDGLPWASPVWFANVGLEQVLWLSRDYRRHSRNLAERADVAIVVFDSRQPPVTGLAAYLRGTVEVVPDDELERAIAPYSERSLADGLDGWSAPLVRSGPAQLYRARITEVSLLPGNGTDDRIPVPSG